MHKKAPNKYSQLKDIIWLLKDCFVLSSLTFQCQLRYSVLIWWLCQNSDPIFSSLAPCFLHVGRCTKVFLHTSQNSAISSKIRHLPCIQLLYRFYRKNILLFQEEKSMHYGLLCDVCAIFSGGKMLNDTQSLCMKALSLLENRLHDTIPQIKIWCGRGVFPQNVFLKT
jgi:hypothetical protein